MNHPSGEPIPRADWWDAFTWRHALFVFLILTGILFGDVLFTSDDVVLSAKGLDLYAGEMSSLEFQLGELKQGHLPIWNPHVFSGTPNLATPLYPAHLLGLVLPLTRAINLEIALHVLLIGFFMYLWSSSRGLHPLAALVCGMVILFSGPFWLHVYAGHMGNLFAMTWVPLLFLAVDRILEKPSAGWVAGGALIAALQILTGQYQYVYYTALTVLVYVALHVWSVPAGRRWRALGALCGILAGAVALSAFYLFPSISAGAESIRAGGMSYAFASMFGLPPENLLTLVTPFFFGDMETMPYWGRWYLWEMCLFAGTAGLTLAVYGTVCGEASKRRQAPVMVLVMMVLALGVNTPLFAFLYEWLPGFGTFRGTSKFSFQAMIFLGLLAGVGLDRLIRRPPFPKNGVLLVILAGLGLLGASLWLFHSSSPEAAGGLWERLVRGMAATGESYFPQSLYQNPAIVAGMAKAAAVSALAAAALFLLVALLLRGVGADVRVNYILILVVLLEGFVFAWMSRPVFHYRDTLIPEFREFYEARPGDYRVLNRVAPNTAMSTGSRDIWGYGPMVLKRYAQFMAVTQHVDPDRASTYLPLRAYDPLWDLLRLRYILLPAAGGMAVREVDRGIPRVQLLTDWKAAKGRDEVFALLTDPAFAPGKTVILEESPGIPPSPPATAGTCSVRDDGSDRLIVKADVSRASILLLAENYSAGWRIEPITPGPQPSYAILPADYTLMAIPLEPGQHAFAVRYRPRSFTLGVWLSLTVWILLAAWGLWRGTRGFRRERHRRHQDGDRPGGDSPLLPGREDRDDSLPG